jgi:hypothetical protein
MGNKYSSSYTKLKDKVKDKVCVVFPCYLAINKITHRAKCVCNCGKMSDNPDDIVVFINRFYLPDKKIGFYFFKLNNVYDGEPFVLEDSLIIMYPTPNCQPNEEFEKIITKNLYDVIVERYKWQYDADGKLQNHTKPWNFIWTIKQKKELERLNVL